MSLSKKSLLIYLLYIVSTSIIFLTINSSLIENKNIKFFFHDTDIKYKIEASLALDPNNGWVVIPRMFHNKVLYSIDTFSNSIYQSLDPVFLFSLGENALYTEPNGIKMLYPIELPLFIIALAYIVRNWNFKKDKYFYLLIILLVSIVNIGIFLPSSYPLKLLPFVIMLRTIIFFGMTDLLVKHRWLKKYFS